jgi:putative ABC transport system substrate-binding protein
VAATPTIPIVFSIGGDPIKLGIVRSLNRPAGNATGVYLFASDLVPTSALIGVLLNPNNANAETQSKDVQEAARAIGQKIQIVHAVGRLPHGMGVARLADLSAEWSRQRQMLGLPVL